MNVDLEHVDIVFRIFVPVHFLVIYSGKRDTSASRSFLSGIT